MYSYNPLKLQPAPILKGGQMHPSSRAHFENVAVSQLMKDVRIFSGTLGSASFRKGPSTDPRLESVEC